MSLSIDAALSDDVLTVGLGATVEWRRSLSGGPYRCCDAGARLVDRAPSDPRGNEGARQGLRLAVFRRFLRDVSAIGLATRAVQAPGR
jgi:hypothetical protein